MTLSKKSAYTRRTVPPFSVTSLADRPDHFGFTECSTLRALILCICGDTAGPPELCYIRLKLRECLGRRHDGSAWFADLCEAERWVGAARQCQLATDDRWHVCCYGPVVPWWRRKRLHRDRNESGSAGKVQESLTVKITPVKYQIIVNPMFPCQCGHAGTRLQAQLCHADFELQWQVRRAFSKGRFISRLKA